MEKYTRYTNIGRYTYLFHEISSRFNVTLKKGKKKKREKVTTKSKTDAGHTKWLDKYVAGPWLRPARAAPVSP